jgi:hypothetical protein
MTIAASLRASIRLRSAEHRWHLWLEVVLPKGRPTPRLTIGAIAGLLAGASLGMSKSDIGITSERGLRGWRVGLSGAERRNCLHRIPNKTIETNESWAFAGCSPGLEQILAHTQKSSRIRSREIVRLHRKEQRV